MIQLRERLDGRLFIGKVLRVLHNREGVTKKIDLGVTREDKKILDLQEASSWRLPLSRRALVYTIKETQQSCR